MDRQTGIMELILWLIAAYAMICVAVYFGNRARTAPAAAQALADKIGVDSHPS